MALEAIVVKISKEDEEKRKEAEREQWKKDRDSLRKQVGG